MLYRGFLHGDSSFLFKDLSILWAMHATLFNFRRLSIKILAYAKKLFTNSRTQSL
jgi:hypothetical protein